MSSEQEKRFFTSLLSVHGTGFTLPSSESSPQKIILAALSEFTIPSAASIPTAIGRSNPAPSFFRAAGARFTVIRSKGKGYPEFWIAALTLSLLSLTMLSGSPTVANPGKPEARSTSTSTRRPRTPSALREVHR